MFFRSNLELSAHCGIFEHCFYRRKIHKLLKRILDGMNLNLNIFCLFRNDIRFAIGFKVYNVFKKLLDMVELEFGLSEGN